MGVHLDRGLLSFSSCFYVWLSLLLARPMVIQGSSTSSETDYNMPHRLMQPVLVISKTMKERPISCKMQWPGESRELEEM